MRNYHGGFSPRATEEPVQNPELSVYDELADLYELPEEEQEN